ncbi:hypothetical protein LGQ02_12925 [Bacillus shivajii]|uniref:hypothetical protein n=1 Tax=Bacillus shivajii TaxID=1983719 RepID=UPI001CF931EC|nr:hypothetical protein [Bacillus shivajii]UCZ51764.1 hypothetical protein LGQ02_12925 [Bacillus shivajii]
MKSLFYLFVMSFLLIMGCSQTNKENELALIDADFHYPSFTTPEEWEIIAVIEELEMKKYDLYEPKNNEFYDIPLSYIIEYGNKTDVNDYERGEYVKILHAQNEDQGLWGRTTLYMHSSEKTYGSFGMGREPYPRIDIRSIDTESFKINDQFSINGIEISYSKQNDLHLFLWKKDDMFYDLFINDRGQHLDDLLEIVQGFVNSE